MLLLTGLLPAISLHNTPSVNSIYPTKLHFSPFSSVKTEASATVTARNYSLEENSQPNYRYPDGKFVSIPRKTNGVLNLSCKNEENEITECISILNKISKSGNFDGFCYGCRQVHGRLVKLGVVKRNAFVGNKLVVLYAKNSEFLDDARKLFDEIPKRDVSAFAALIGGFGRIERWVDLFSVLGMMVNDGLLPDRFLIPMILKACSAIEIGNFGRMIHGFVLRRGMEIDVFLGNGLIDMYANCGDLNSSRNVFDSMSERDVVSWTALVVAYMAHGMVEEAVDTFHNMELNGEEGDLISWNALISGFAHNGEIEMALETLTELREKGLNENVNTWNGIISGCSQNSFFEEAIDAYIKMFSSFLTPNVVSIVSVLPACSGLEDLKLGEMIHGHAIKLGLKGNIQVDGSLIGMYWKCDKTDTSESIFRSLKFKNTAICNEMIAAYTSKQNVEDALRLFHSMKEIGPNPDEITYNTILAAYVRDNKKSETYELLNEMLEMGLHPNIVTFNILVSGYQQSGYSIEALKIFQAMEFPQSETFKSSLIRKPIQPNTVTVTSALAACADLSALNHGKELHGYVIRHGFEINQFVSGALVDMYSKCFQIDSATEVFLRTKDKNTVMWNTLLSGYINTKGAYKVFGIFKSMLEEGFEPSPVTCNILLTACGEIGNPRFGMEIHGYILKCFLDDSSKYLTTALIDMYARCGLIFEARRVFDSETDKDNAVWNSMIYAFSAHGMTQNAITLFKELEMEGIVPDGKTFTAVLSACVRNGLMEEGWKYFTQMSTNFGISPNLEHYTCMIGIMGNAGLLDEALAFIKAMPFESDSYVWATLLRACKAHSNPEIGEQAARALIEHEPENASNYIILSNIYAASGWWRSSKVLKKMVKDLKSMTLNECSSISIGSKIHVFERGMNSSVFLDRSLKKWREMGDEMRGLGHSVEDPVLKDEDKLDPCSCSHTEKLAICYGIVSLRNSQPIRVSKNLRMCFDCHLAGKLISEIVGREIFVKDVSFFHHMKNGECSCHDRW